MKKSLSWAAISTILLLLAISCAPKGTPAQPVAPAPVKAAPTAAPASIISSPNPQDTAWQNIVDAAKKEGRLTIYSGNFTGDIGIALSRGFKERYGIQVDVITGRGTEFIQRLQTEKRMGTILADVEDTSGTNAKLMKQQGLTKSIADELPALKEKGVWAADIFGLDPVDKHAIAFNFSTYSPFVNTNLVKPGEEPKAWKDLLSPKWKSKMMAINPTSSAGLINNFVPLMREKVIDTEFLKALYAQDMQFTVSAPDEASRLSRGERPLSVADINISFAKFVAEGAPIRAIEMDDGMVMSPLPIVAFDGGPHPNAAKVFVNWLLSPEGQTVWNKANGAPGVRKDVTSFLPKGAQTSPKRPIMQTNEDADESGKLFREQWLNKLWGR